MAAVLVGHPYYVVIHESAVNDNTDKTELPQVTPGLTGQAGMKRDLATFC